MKGDLESYIYIIITIVAFAVSLLGKKKKKPNPIVREHEPDEEYERPQNPFMANLEQILRNEMGIQNQSPYDRNVEYITEPIIEPEDVEEIIKEEVLDSAPSKMFEKDIIPYSIEYDDSDAIHDAIQDSDLTKQTETNNAVLDDFDIRKAVIYSEILNRKEF